jgi:uncharacterized protein (DUF58 family)
MLTGSLVPSAMGAPLRSRGRMPFAFGTRFFVALLLGLIWLVPAWWTPRLIAAMFLWDVFVIAAWFFDLSRLPAPPRLEARRIFNSALSFARPASVEIEIQNHGRTPVYASMIDETPLSLCAQPPAMDASVPVEMPVRRAYPIVPNQRGDVALGRLFLRYRSSFGFAERWAVADIAQTVRVLPDLEQARRYALYLIRSRQVEMEKRRQRHRGMGREFEALREYRQEDDLRDISWPATARRHHLITRTYQMERSQTVWIVIDAGRLLRAQVRDPSRDFRPSKLDYAVDAALSLAQVASQHGDRVGLLVYGRTIQRSVGVARGPLHVRSILDALSQVRGEASEANHALAARALLRTQSRRSLIIWITDFAETPTTPEVIEYAGQMSGRHLVVFAAVTQPDLLALGKSIPQTEEEMFRQAAGLEIIQRRELLLRGLRQRGVLAIDLVPGKLAESLINQYLEVKDRGRL